MTTEDWRLINSFAPWLSAIGSLSAVGLALHLARRDKRVRLEVSVGERLAVTPGSGDRFPSYLAIRITNIGHREAQIYNLTWKGGILRKIHAVQTGPKDAFSSPLPIRLKDGEEANYFISLEEKPSYLDSFMESFLPDKLWLRLKFLRLRVHTTVGSDFSTRVEKGFAKKCIERAKERAQQTGDERKGVAP